MNVGVLLKGSTHKVQITTLKSEEEARGNCLFEETSKFSIKGGDLLLAGNYFTNNAW